jgi:arabinogalactan endo-1,4-beta-galactosidase
MTTKMMSMSLLFTVALAAQACTQNGSGQAQGHGGTTGSGGSTASAGTGGASGTGGNTGVGGTMNTATGGAPGTGGRVATGGTSSSGGAATGGSGSTTTAGGAGGRGAGGTTTTSAGETTSGGTSGGASDAGSATGGNAGGRGGSAGTFSASYLIGADISFSQIASVAGQDSLMAQLKSHGFNAIRLRTFVDPKAADGYDRTDGMCDLAHTIAMGKRVKDLGMFLLVDFHYSDNWADPGKQCVPVAWQKYTTITDLATAVHDYTKDSITKLIAGGARPDMVQIGNETTPGMLLHVCDADGKPTGDNKVTGSISNWANLGALFKAGIQGAKDVDPGILTALHIDRGGDKVKEETAGTALTISKTYITNAIKQGVTFDVFGESCYQQYQGDPGSTANTKTTWTNTLGGLAAAFPTIKILAAEYGPMQREINDVVYGIANKQGLGTFNWEPERGGDWNTGHVLFDWSGNTFTAQTDLGLYDQMKTQYADRL